MNKKISSGLSERCVLKPFNFNELPERIIELTVNSGTINNFFSIGLERIK
jgi:hypothetical protein